MRDAERMTKTRTLKEAMFSGDLGGAYKALQGLSPQDASVVAKECGFSVIGLQSGPAFFTHMQKQVAEAVRNKTDGFGLRKLQRDRPS